MSSAAIIAIAIGVVVILAAISFVTLARKSDVRGAGALSGETRKRDRTGRETRPTEAVVETTADGPRGRGPGLGRPVRHDHRAGPRGGAGPVDAARSRGARRQPPAVLQPGHRHADQRRHRRLLRRRLRRLPLADGVGWLRPAGHRRQDRRHPRVHPHRRRLLLRPVRPDVDHRVPAPTPCPRPRPSTPTTSSPAWRRASSPSTRSARTSAAASRRAPRASGSSARATARSTTRSARRRPARRRAAWTASRSRSSGSGDVTVDTGTVVPGPPIGTNTTGQEAEGPHCITGGGKH